MHKVLFALFLFTSFFVNAQKEIFIDEAIRPMSKDSQPSFLVEIPQAKLEETQKDWLKYISAGSKGKATVVNGENLQPAAVVKNISPNPINIYSKLLETTEGVRLTAWFTENDSVFMSARLNGEQDLAIQKYLRDFAIKKYQDAVKAEVNVQQQILDGMNKELKELIKEEEKANKKISESNRAIQKSNDNIATNNADIQATGYKITDQKGMVERTAADKNANKGAKQTLKDLENNKKKLLKQNENENKNIDAMNKAIRELERNVADYKEKIAAKNTQIEQQKQNVANTQKKLEGIK